MTSALLQPIVILISGSGSNMEAIIRAQIQRGWRTKWGAEVTGVISNRADARGLKKAAAHGVATAVVEHQQFENRVDFDQALADQIDRMAAQGQRPALVILAGFMRILTPAFVSRHAGRLLNIHPSLLPAFPGLHTHERALEAGCRFAGATVHEVTAELDHGHILEQAVVPVLATDDASTLAQRVLSQEHRIYPQAIEQWFDRSATEFNRR